MYRRNGSLAGSAGAFTASLLILLSVLPATGLAAQAAPEAPRRVLVLYSYSRDLPWESKIADGLEEILDGLSPNARPVLFEERLDSDRLGDIGSAEAWADYLALKYKNVRLDAVVSESQQAAGLLFASPGLFPGVKRYILNCAPASASSPGNAERRYSSVSNIEEAVRTVLRLLPETRGIIVVSDRSAVGKARTAQALSLAPSLKDTSIESWNEFTLAELLEKARALSAGTAIFYLPVLSDRLGAPLVAAGVASDLAREAPVPVFSHFDTLLGTGIVGGYSISAVQLGRAIGRIAAFGDTGAPADQAAYAETLLGYWFDSRALERWRIPDGRLPEGSTVLFREQTWLERHWLLLTIVLILFSLESLLVVAFARSSAQRKRAMAALETERASLEGKVLERTADLSAVNAKLYREIEERKASEERERAAAAEKATLFTELQHRIKNSLGIIVSLIGLETGKAGSDDVRATLETLESRVAALSALYDILYDTGGIGDIPLADYLERIIAAAAESLGADARGIVVDSHIAPVSMDMKRAVSLGLVVNELVTDCLKHAFPDGRNGRVSVRLTADGSSFRLVVEDDGIGLPPGLDPETAAGFGFKLVGLLAGQLGAEFTFDTGTGASFSLRIPA